MDSSIQIFRLKFWTNLSISCILYAAPIPSSWIVTLTIFDEVSFGALIATMFHWVDKWSWSSGGNFSHFHSLRTEETNQNQSYFAADSQSVHLGVEPLRDSWPDFGCIQRQLRFCLRWGDTPIERTCLSLTGHSPCLCWQYIHMYIKVRVR